MKLYYANGSIIDDVEFAANTTGGLRAYAHAHTGAAPEQLMLAKNSLEKEGLFCQPMHKDGRDVLEIRGFKKPQQLTRCLQANGLVGDVARTEKLPNDPINAGKDFKKTAILTGAGISYNIGDVGYLTYAFKKFGIWKNPSAHLNHAELAKMPQLSAGEQKMTNATNMMDIVAAVGYAAGSLALTRYGHGDRSQSMIEETNKKVKNYLEDSGYKVDADTTLSHNSQDRSNSFFKRVDNFCKKYPSEIFNSIYIVVGLFLGAASFYRAVRAHTLGNLSEAKEEAIDVGLGAMTFASAMTGLAVREKRIDENDRRHGLGRVIDWIQEKPLRAVGVGYAISTGFHATSTYHKIKSGDIVAKKTIMGRAIFVATNVISELLLFFSSKGHGDGIKPDKSVDSSVLAATAEVITRQPLEKRPQLIANLAGYLAGPEMLDIDIKQAQERLTRAVHELDNNPWRLAITNAQAPQREPVAETPVAASLQNKPLSSIAGDRVLDSVLSHKGTEALVAH